MSRKARKWLLRTAITIAIILLVLLVSGLVPWWNSRNDGWSRLFLYLLGIGNGICLALVVGYAFPYGKIVTEDEWDQC